MDLLNPVKNLAREAYIHFWTGRPKPANVEGCLANFKIGKRQHLFRLNQALDEPMLPEFLKALEEGDVVLDVGADQGVYTFLSLGKQVKRSDAVEMNPERFNTLMENKKLNEGSISNNVYCWDVEAGEGETGRRLDSLIRETPDVIKIDVEGAELRVLEGMDEFIEDVRTVFIEVHPEYMEDYNDSKQELYGFLESHGFTVDVIGTVDEPTPRIYVKAVGGN